MNQFSTPLLAWFDKHGRKNLPWQHPRTAYRVWISEIMLQQTQVQTVIPFFNRFMTRFPNNESLATTAEDEVLSYWSGLGYYTRIRNIHKTSKIILDNYGNKFPQAIEEIMALPGIGPSTAAAIASQAFNQPTAILDGNVKRVLTRHFLIEGYPEKAAVRKKLEALAISCMSKTRCADYTQAIMDLGATCCTNRKPKCLDCPLSSTCLAYQNSVVSDYPAKKIKNALPIKKQQFLLLYTDNQEIYLEKRPPTGIWGGLWCFPTINIQEDPCFFISQNYNVDCLEISPLLAFRHTFSHFHLDIEAFSIKVVPKADQVRESTGQWYTKASVFNLGIATPISQLIKHFLSSQNPD